MLTGHEKLITEYSNPFMMLCRKYESLPENMVYSLANAIHPSKKHDDLAGAIDAVRRTIALFANGNMHAIDDFDRCMEQLYKAHDINYVDLIEAKNG